METAPACLAGVANGDRAAAVVGYFDPDVVMGPLEVQVHITAGVNDHIGHELGHEQRDHVAVLGATDD